MNADEREWTVIGRASVEWADRQVSDGALDRVLTTALWQVRDGSGRLARLSWTWLVVRAQAPVMRSRLLAASLVMLVLGAALVLAAGRGWAREAFVLLAPLAAAGGTAAVFRDDLGELALTLAASPRLVLLARLVVILATDLVGASAASVVVAGRTQEAVGSVIAAWLGPMLLLVTLSLLLSTLFTPAIGMTVALGAWFVRVLVGLDVSVVIVPAPVTVMIEAAWSTSPVVLAGAGVLAVAAIVVAPRRLVVVS